jgi:hypothetical protein
MSDHLVTHNEADAISELLGVSPTSFEPSQKRGFKPWHKPRKHWIRENQWAKNCRDLMTTSNAAENEFRYLSLPGPDLLDVRFIAQTCAEANKRLLFLGFNNPSDETPDDQISLTKGVAEIVQNTHVSQFSSVIPDRLENLALTNSVAQEHLTKFGSFDAINLDLCNSMLGHVPQSEQSTYYDALHALFEHQKKQRTKPFLLFITTRTGEDTIDISSLAKLGAAVSKNLQHADFCSRLKAEFGVPAHEVNDLISNNAVPSGWSQSTLSRFMSVALGKWLLSLLWNGNPKWKLRLVDSCEYKVHIDRDMLSVTFICEQVQTSVTDSSKLSRHISANVSSATNERSLGLGLLDQFLATFDLDAKLAGDQKLYKELVDRAASLMESAGYVSSDYVEKYSC